MSRDMFLLVSLLFYSIFFFHFYIYSLLKLFFYYSDIFSLTLHVFHIQVTVSLYGTYHDQLCWNFFNLYRNSALGKSVRRKILISLSSLVTLLTWATMMLAYLYEIHFAYLYKIEISAKASLLAVPRVVQLNSLMHQIDRPTNPAVHMNPTWSQPFAQAKHLNWEKLDGFSLFAPRSMF